MKIPFKPFPSQRKPTLNWQWLVARVFDGSGTKNDKKKYNVCEEKKATQAMAVVVPLIKRGDVVYKAPYLTSMPRYAPMLADAVADVNTLLLDIQTVNAYPITKGNPLGITSYSDPAIAAWSGAPPDPAKTFRIASADAMKSVFLRAEFVTKPLSLKEIEFCTGEAARCVQ